MSEPIPRIPLTFAAQSWWRNLFRLPLIPPTRVLRRWIISSYLATERDPKLHVGCGGHLLQGWLNGDLSLFNRRGMVYLDARKQLPFPSNSLTFIFSEHFISCLTLEEGINLFREFWRTLRPGGVVRTATADLAALNNVYAHREPLHDDYVRWASKTFLGTSTCFPAIVLNNFFYGFAFRFVYDLETLAWALKQAGFSKIVRTEIGESKHPALRGVEGHGQFIPAQFNQLETIVLEATKG